jgi:hypothetical protein
MISHGASPVAARDSHFRESQLQAPNQKATGAVSLTAKYTSR